MMDHLNSSSKLTRACEESDPENAPAVPWAALIDGAIIGIIFILAVASIVYIFHFKP